VKIFSQYRELRDACTLIAVFEISSKSCLKKNGGEQSMKGTMLVRTLLALTVLTLIGATAMAEDAKSTITINGGRNTVIMKAPTHVVNHPIKAPAHPFYDNIGTSGYTEGDGYTVSDGSPINTEYTPGSGIVSLKSGTTHKISVGLGFVEGTNGAIVVLDKDCKGIPCGKIDKTNLCKGKVSNLPTFGSTSTTVVSFNCKVTLKKGKTYWVYIESLANSWLAWNLSLSATGDVIEGTNDVWGTPSSGATVGALTIK
jgi:hypothetical protein